MNRISFNGFSFPYNPETYQLHVEKIIKIRPLPKISAQVQVVSLEPKKISGSGAFVGKAAENFRSNLLYLFDLKQSAKMKLPHGEMINAFFTKLKITGDGKSGLLRYEFFFIEDTGNGSGVLN